MADKERERIADVESRAALACLGVKNSNEAILAYMKELKSKSRAAKQKQRFPSTEVTNRIVSSCHGFLMQGNFVWMSEVDLTYLVAPARDRRKPPEDNFMQGAAQKVKDKFTETIKMFWGLKFVVGS
jgi:hypothetical protein